MKADLHKHLQGVFNILKSRFDSINQNIGHNLTAGEENEEEIRQLLIDFLPDNYGVGSGVLIDINGNQSKQVDIIIYDKDVANYTLGKESKIFLVDQVLACIEIKTTFTSGDKGTLRGALENVKSIKELMPSQKTWVEPVNTLEGENEQAWNLKKFVPQLPICIVFFYKAKLPKKACDSDKIKEQFDTQIKQYEINHQPELIFSLEHAMFYRYEDISKTNGSGKFHMCFMKMSDQKKMDVTLPKTSHDLGGLMDFGIDGFFQDSTIKTNTIFNGDETEAYVALTGTKLSSSPVFYKTILINNELRLLDIHRGFMNFILQIDVILRLRRTNKNSYMADYFPEHYFEFSNV